MQKSLKKIVTEVFKFHPGLQYIDILKYIDFIDCSLCHGGYFHNSTPCALINSTHTLMTKRYMLTVGATIGAGGVTLDPPPSNALTQPLPRLQIHGAALGYGNPKVATISIVYMVSFI